MEAQINWTLDYVLIVCLDEKLLDFTPLQNKYLMTLKNTMFLLKVVVNTMKCTRHYAKPFTLY